MDLNGQALLVTALSVLGPAAVAHMAAPGRLARTITHHRLLPGTAASAAAPKVYAGLLVALELAMVGVCSVALFASVGRLAGLVLAGGGVAFVVYVSVLVVSGYQGDCGCSPLTSSVTWLSAVPGGVLFVTGALLAVDRPFDDVAFGEASGPLQNASALGAAAVVGSLVALLPATALTGDPLSLQPEE